MNKEKIKWKQWCNTCEKNHIVWMQPCPSCGVYETPQPSERVIGIKGCHANYDCDGCEAYRDHLY